MPGAVCGAPLAPTHGAMLVTHLNLGEIEPVRGEDVWLEKTFSQQTERNKGQAALSEA